MQGMMRLCGHLLLWFGFLLGAFVAVRSAEVAGDPWSTISWPTYAIALFTAVLGVIVLRITKRAMGSDSQAGTAAAIDEMATILARLRKTVDGWNASSAEIPVYAVHGKIDDQLSDDLGRFADLREALIVEFGLDRYAQIMTEFALAERTINRTWSASADGYVDEVRTCLTRAAAHLSAACQRLDEAQEAQNGVTR
jgi:hypothetical protein